MKSSKNNENFNSFYPLVFFILFNLAKIIANGKNKSFHISKNGEVLIDNNLYGYLEHLNEIELLFKLFRSEKIEFILKSKSKLLIIYENQESLIPVSIPSYFKRIKVASYFKKKTLENMQYLFNMFRINSFYEQNDMLHVRRNMLFLISSILKCRKEYIHESYDFDQLKIRDQDSPIVVDQQLSGSTFISTIIEDCDQEDETIGSGSVHLFVLILERLFDNFIDYINGAKRGVVQHDKYHFNFTRSPIISIKEMYELDLNGVLSNDLIPKTKQDSIELGIKQNRLMEEKAHNLFKEIFLFDEELFLIKSEKYILLENGDGKELEKIKLI